MASSDELTVANWVAISELIGLVGFVLIVGCVGGYYHWKRGRLTPS